MILAIFSAGAIADDISAEDKAKAEGPGKKPGEGEEAAAKETPEAYEVAEESFFVVNLQDDPDFTDQISKLGEKFCQDAVLIVPRGAEGAYLFGTNNSEFPGFGQRIEAGNLSFGREKEFMTKVGNRPMAFTEELETYKDLSRLERMAAKAMAKKVLQG